MSEVGFSAEGTAGARAQRQESRAYSATGQRVAPSGQEGRRAGEKRQHIKRLL